MLNCSTPGIVWKYLHHFIINVMFHLCVFFFLRVRAYVCKNLDLTHLNNKFKFKKGVDCEN